MHRWALKMLSYDMDLKWRKGTEHIAPDALSRLRRKGPLEPDVDTSIPGDSQVPSKQKGPAGPVLDGTLLQDLAPPEQDEVAVLTPADLEPLGLTPQDLQQLIGDTEERDERSVDGIRLQDLGLTEIDAPNTTLSTFYAVQLTPDTPVNEKEIWTANYEQVRSFLSQRPPRAVIMGQGAGGALTATDGLVDLTCVFDSDWRTLEFIRANGGARNAELRRVDVRTHQLDCWDKSALTYLVV